ncbi:hypothetical protein NBRC3188_1291 [Acetobacter pasteurianus NBRC 3188]|uniref:Uncharacterized protein n=1 Tax=Acetobacter pasteurianus NBRC 3188 TaxID=1226663 RepID=A0A401WTL0_ACEPA|nr:hypothetical protein NBRC3188_1291 [Acetobacter pasteurianus NBRC 3188]
MLTTADLNMDIQYYPTLWTRISCELTKFITLASDYQIGATIP